MQERFSLPPEAVANVPYVQIRGNKSVSIENHRGIMEYTQKKIVIALKQGKICVHGDELRISGMNRCSIEVHGLIFSVALE